MRGALAVPDHFHSLPRTSIRPRKVNGPSIGSFM